MKRLIQFFDRHIMAMILVILIGIMLGVVVSPLMLKSVPAGEAGAIWRRFGGGTDTETVLGEGLHVIWPFDKVTIYEVRLRRVETAVKVLTTEGITVEVTAVVRFRLDPSDVGRLHKFIGPDYLDRLVMPPIIGRIRAVIGPRRPDQIYAALQNAIDVEREIENYVRDRITAQVKMFDWDGSAVQIVDVLLLQVKLPDYVNAAIERKAEQEQMAQEYNYRLDRERLEAERKAIEANGIKRFQETIGTTLTEPFLRWRGIEATEKLANSTNAKVLLFGAPQTGLPLILGGAEGINVPTSTTTTTTTKGPPAPAAPAVPVNPADPPTNSPRTPR
jgi:prohibitin 2